MKKIVKPHKARKPSASTDVPSFARGKDDHRYYDYIIAQSMLGNPTAKRMTGEDNRYIPAFGQGDRSNLVLGSYGNYATPSVMNIGGELMYIPNPWEVLPEWMVHNQSFKFNNPNDTIDFAESYKYSSPAFSEFFGVDNSVNYDKGKDKTWYNELNDSMLGAGIKFVDPTGISSYYDVYQSAQNMYNNPSWSNAGSLALETFGALPLIGKLGKALKIGKKIIKRGGEPELEKMGQWIIDQGYPRMIGITKDGADAQEYDRGKDSGIHIKKKNRGKFTAAAKRAGMGVQAYARKILRAPKGKYSSTLRKRANFAANAAKWHK